MDMGKALFLPQICPYLEGSKAVLSAT